MISKVWFERLIPLSFGRAWNCSLRDHTEIWEHICPCSSQAGHSDDPEKQGVPFHVFETIYSPGDLYLNGVRLSDPTHNKSLRMNFLVYSGTPKAQELSLETEQILCCRFLPSMLQLSPIDSARSYKGFLSNRPKGLVSAITHGCPLRFMRALTRLKKISESYAVFIIDEVTYFEIVSQILASQIKPCHTILTCLKISQSYLNSRASLGPPHSCYAHISFPFPFIFGYS